MNYFVYQAYRTSEVSAFQEYTARQIIYIGHDDHLIMNQKYVLLGEIQLSTAKNDPEI